MNKINMAFGAAGVAVLLAGCGPELAEVPYGAEEARWQETLRQNYSGYEAPRTAPPAIRDNVSPRLMEQEERQREVGSGEAAPVTAPAASDDPAAVADKAADQASDKPVADRPAAEKVAEKPAEKVAGKPAADKAAGSTEEYVVKPGDNLGKIAKAFYGDARRYDVIVKANPQLEADPNKLKVGMKLAIPKI